MTVRTTRILIKRGLSENLDGVTLERGELAVTTDTHSLYVGDGAGGKVQIGLDADGLRALLEQLGDIPVLSGDGKLPESMLPAIAITDVFEAANESAMLSLTAQKGDIAVRADLNKTFILKAAPAAEAANWVELRTPTDNVLSVNGKTGAVALAAADLGLGNVNNTSDADKPISSAAQNALNQKAPLVNPALSGVPTAPTAALDTDTTQIATTAFVKGQNYIADGDIIDGGEF